MPDLDLTDVLTDPDLSDGFTVLRRRQVVDGRGRSSTVVERFAAVGVVAPAGNGALQRLPEATYQGKTLTVLTTFRLRGVSQTGEDEQWAPDVIEWPVGSRDYFTVSDLQDWTRFGVGFVNATCSAISYVDEVPGSSGDADER